MAVGNIVNSVASVAAGSSLDIKPSSGEWVIHNVYYNTPTSGNINFRYTDGTNYVTFDTDTTNGARLGMVTHCNQTYWLNIQNTGTAAVLVGYDGMQTA